MLSRLILLTLVALIVVAGFVLLRRSRRPPAPTRDAVPALREPPAEAAPPESAVTLDHAEAERQLLELAFTARVGADIPAEHERVAAAAAEVLESAATDPRYAPRRPLLLPQLLKAVGDSDTSRRELADLISRDPSLAGSLLKLANGPLYRRRGPPVESVERAITVIGTDGIRSLAAAALVQPVFRARSGAFAKFPEIVWEHTYAAAVAAQAHAKTVGQSDPFAAHLLALVTGLASIVILRVALDQYGDRRDLRPDASTIAALLRTHTALVADRVAASWELSDRLRDALATQEEHKPVTAAAPLRRSLRFGTFAGALAVLKDNGRIDDTAARASLAAHGGPGPATDRLWSSTP
jgi:HD-like signal output (HDOD) protein